MNENPTKSQAPQATLTPPPTQAKSEPKQPEKAVQKPIPLVQARPSPVLRFSPAAWAKLLFFRDHKGTEVGGFGVTSANDLLRVEDFLTVKQEVSVASVAFDDQAVADFFEAQVDAGRKPEQFARIWLHTHPGNSPHPSSTDEETFARVFGGCQWAVMFVLAQGGKSYARLRFNVGPGGHVVIPAEVDFGAPFGPSQKEAWEVEYKTNVTAEHWGLGWNSREDLLGQTDLVRCSVPGDWLEELEAMEPAERKLLIDELAARPDLWGETAEVVYED